MRTLYKGDDHMPQQIPPQVTVVRTAIYIRVSSDEQARFGDSIRDQRESGLHYIDSHKHNILQDIYIDDGISGQKLERGDFQKLMEHVSAGLIDLIIFTKLDRWFRNLRHYLNTQALLEANHVSWLAVDQPYFDTSTPYGRAFVAQSMTWAELEAQNGGIRIRDVFKNKVSHGEVISGKIPRGYRIENKHMVPSEEAPMILDIFHYVRKTQSLSQTLIYMEQEHGITMTRNNLRQSILRNTKYIGMFRDNSDFCPRIVPDDLFYQVQHLLDQNQTVKSGQKYDYLFSGLLICDRCGCRLSGGQINVLVRKKSGAEYRYRYPAYHCRQYANHKCENGGKIRESKLEEHLLHEIQDEMNQYLASYSTKQKAPVDHKAKKQALPKKLERLKALYLNGVLSLEEYQSDRQCLTQQISALTDAADPIPSTPPACDLLSAEFGVIYQTFDPLEKRLFWRSILKEIRVSSNSPQKRTYHIIFL